MKREVANAYWQDVLREVNSPPRVILVATTANGEVAGSAQLAISPKDDARHRAEVQKLLVHSRYRKQGLGRRLMDAIEAQ